MDLRKVQLTGGSSLTVTLPKDWVEKIKLKPGDVVGCTEQADGSLAVHAHAKSGDEPQRYRVDIGEGSEAYLFRKIIAAYLMGYDQIVVSGKGTLSIQARRAVQKAVRRIIGLEIVEEGPTSITLQDFLDPREFHMGKALRRVAMLTQAMQQESAAAIGAPSQDLAESVAERDDEVDRLYWLMNKQYHAILRDASYAAKMGLTAGQALNLLLVGRLMERTADHAGRIAGEALLLKGHVPQNFLERMGKQAERAQGLFQEAFQTFVKGDAKRADAIIDEANRFEESQKKLLREATSLGSEAVAHLAFVIESIGRTAAYAADVAEIAINHKVATPEPSA